MAEEQVALKALQVAAEKVKYQRHFEEFKEHQKTVFGLSELKTMYVQTFRLIIFIMLKQHYRSNVIPSK